MAFFTASKMVVGIRFFGPAPTKLLAVWMVECHAMFPTVPRHPSKYLVIRCLNPKTSPEKAFKGFQTPIQQVFGGFGMSRVWRQAHTSLADVRKPTNIAWGIHVTDFM